LQNRNGVVVLIGRFFKNCDSPAYIRILCFFTAHRWPEFGKVPCKFGEIKPRTQLLKPWISGRDATRGEKKLPSWREFLLRRRFRERMMHVVKKIE
jgi:hypothetical protein